MKAKTRGLRPWQVLIALYDGATVPPGGPAATIAYGAKMLTREEAQEILEEHPYVDYLGGRIIKTHFDTVEQGYIDALMYDRDTKPGGAQAAIDFYIAASGGELQAAIDAAYRLDAEGDLHLSMGDLRAGAAFETATLADMRLSWEPAHKANRVFLHDGDKKRCLKNRWAGSYQDETTGERVYVDVRTGSLLPPEERTDR